MGTRRDVSRRAGKGADSRGGHARCQEFSGWAADDNTDHGFEADQSAVPVIAGFYASGQYN
jgi:hypothetical protein